MPILLLRFSTSELIYFLDQINSSSKNVQNAFLYIYPSNICLFVYKIINLKSFALALFALFCFIFYPWYHKVLMDYLIFCFVFFPLFGTWKSFSSWRFPFVFSCGEFIIFWKLQLYFSLVTPYVGTLDLSIMSLNICFVLYSHSVHSQFDILAH